VPTKLVPEELEAGDAFGSSVAVATAGGRGWAVAVGAPARRGGAGALYIYWRSAREWPDPTQPGAASVASF
jgi:hypothetical protein